MGRAAPKVALQIASSPLKAKAELNHLETPGGFLLQFAESSSCPVGFATVKNEPLVFLLLQVRADPDLPNNRGHTPRQLADLPMRELIMEHELFSDLPQERILKPLDHVGSPCEFGASGSRAKKCQERQANVPSQHA